jgi:FtsH-binding integral membrane protein
VHESDWLTFQAAVVTNANGAIVGLTSFGQMIFSGPAVLVLFLGTLGLLILISSRINSLGPSTVLTLFIFYAALLGLMMSTIFLTYTGASITRVFFILAAAFGGLSLYGYITFATLSAVFTLIVGGVGAVFDAEQASGVLIAGVIGLILSFLIIVYGALAVFAEGNRSYPVWPCTDRSINIRSTFFGKYIGYSFFGVITNWRNPRIQGVYLARIAI